MFVSVAGTAAGTHSRRFRRGYAVAAIVAAAGLSSAGCAAGQVAQTADQKSAIDGINVSVRTMDLRIVALQPPPSQRTTYAKGSNAAFDVVFVNNGRRPDRLVDISTSAAAGWTAYSSVADTFRAVEGTQDSPSASASTSPSSTTSPSTTTSSASASGSSSGSTPSSTQSGSTSASSTTESSAPQGIQSVTIPTGGRVGFGTPESTGGLVLEKLTRTLRPADTIKVVFTFANAGSVTVPVTVQVADLGRTASVGEPGEG